MQVTQGDSDFEPIHRSSQRKIPDDQELSYIESRPAVYLDDMGQ